MQTLGSILKKIEKRLPQGGTSKEMNQQILEYPPIQQFIHDHQDRLSVEMISNSMSKLNEFMREKKAIARGEQGQNPGFKPELFINYNYIDVTYVPTQQYLDSEKIRYYQSLIDNRMMSEDVKQAQLDQYDLSTYERQQLMEEISDFLEAIQTKIQDARGLYISGPFGVGKTYLLGALANSLASIGIAVTMIHYPTFATELKSLIGQDSRLFDAISKIKQVSVLIIDDIGAESNSAWLRDDVLGVILEHRMKESLPTFFTSNFSMRELELHLSSIRDADEPMKAKRIMERVRYLAKEKSLNGQNRRLANRQ